jgi:Na+/H+ antiporter NhaD/arsenite permease-like protein
MPALIIFAGTYAVVALGRVPGLRLDRAGAALLGAALMVASGSLTLDEAYRAIDFDTLTLLLGMMIIVAHLRFAGFFELVAQGIGGAARRPILLLIGIATAAALLSAFLVNDTVCLMLTPLVAEIALSLRRNPMPYLLAVATSSNIGSVATITGNPQNILIGSVAQIPYGEFALHLAPVAAIGTVLAVAWIALVYRGEFWNADRLAPPPLVPRWDGFLLLKALAATLGAVLLFFLGVTPAKAAILMGALLLVTRRVKPERVMREIDGSLLLLFAGLFVVVAGLEKAVLAPVAPGLAATLQLGDPLHLAAAAAILANLVSNLPAVLLLKPFVEGLAAPHQAWLVLAMAATLAGNFTILGSVANLIVVQRARRLGIEIGFWSYFKVGAPLTVATLAVGLWLLG